MIFSQLILLSLKCGKIVECWWTVYWQNNNFALGCSWVHKHDPGINVSYLLCLHIWSIVLNLDHKILYNSPLHQSDKVGKYRSFVHLKLSFMFLSVESSCKCINRIHKNESNQFFTQGCLFGSSMNLARKIEEAAIIDGKNCRHP